MSDARRIVADYNAMSTDDTTVLRHEQIRVNTSVYTGTLDADASTTVILGNIPQDVIVLGVLSMVNDSASPTLWRVHDNQVGATAATGYRLVYGTPAPEVTFADVGANLQSQAYRLVVFWVDRI